MTNNDTEGMTRELQQAEIILKALPPRYARTVKPDFEMLHKVQKSGILLYGAVGTGKTHKMIEVIYAYLHEKYIIGQDDAPLFELKPDHIRGVFHSVPDVLRQIKGEFDSSDRPQIVDRMIKTPILFLDDLGAEKASDWVKEQLYIVLNERYMWCRPVMITSNLEVSEIAQHYGDRFASRLVEMCTIVKLGGEDRRLK